MRITGTVRDVTVPDEGDIISPVIPVEAIMAYSMGKLPTSFAEGLLQRAQASEPDTGLRVRVAEVCVDGVWVPL